MAFKVTIDKLDDSALTPSEAKALLTKIGNQIAGALADHDFSNAPFVFEVDPNLQTKWLAFKNIKEKFAGYKNGQSISTIYQDTVIVNELKAAPVALQKEFSISLNHLARKGYITFKQVRALNILQVANISGIGQERALFIAWLFGLED